jgi:hypothetical protein
VPNKPADDDMCELVVQSASCPTHQGFEYTKNLNIFAVNIPTRIVSAVPVALKLIERELAYSPHSVVLLTLCGTMDPIDHYTDNNFKYYLKNCSNIHAVVSAWILMSAWRPILKIITLGRSAFKISLQIYVKKQIWLTGFEMDPAYVPRAV